MFGFLLWCLLFVLCWPLALLALILWPIVWLISLPFRLLGRVGIGKFESLRMRGGHRDQQRGCEGDGGAKCPVQEASRDQIAAGCSEDCEDSRSARENPPE